MNSQYFGALDAFFKMDFIPKTFVFNGQFSHSNFISNGQYVFTTFNGCTGLLLLICENLISEIAFYLPDG